MRKGIVYTMVTISWMLLAACQQHETIEQPDCTKAHAKVPAFALEHLASSRTDISIDPEHGVTFAWNATDSLGVFPRQGYQAAFSLESQPENDRAVFDGGTWRLRPHTTYAAYYPFSSEAYDLTYATLKADYGTQVQHGNNSTRHLPVHDYLAAGFVTVNSAEETHFALRHLGSLVRFVITAPTADTWRYLRLQGADDEFMTEAVYDLSEPLPRLHAVQTADTLRINMDGIVTTAADQQIVLYAMVASNPAATLSEWAFVLRGDGGFYRDTLRSYVDGDGIPHEPVRYLEPGTAYSRSIPFSGVSLGEDWTIPIHADDDTYDPTEPILAPGWVGIRATSYDYDDSTSSRMEMHEGTRITFTWTEGDVLGIFPVGGNQTAFPLSSQAGQSLALFDGNDWALRPGWRYAAYYPFVQNNFHRSPNHLPVSFEGQRLDGRRPMDNVGRYNFSYAPLQQVESDSAICFEMKGLATIVKATMKCPEADQFTKLVVSDPQLGIAHEAYYDLMNPRPQLMEEEGRFYESLDFEMLNCQTTLAGEPLVAYIMLMPSDHRSSSLRFTLVGRKNTYCAEVRGRTLQAGSAVALDLQMTILQDSIR